jgi:predicted ATP-dependent endonuclease of OLD family
VQLESLEIAGYRSIEGAELTNLGRFNVLIGKNNSGKSNILSALRALFSCLRDGKAVSLAPPIGKEAIDYFRSQPSKEAKDIEITAVFRLTLQERDTILTYMADDPPTQARAKDNLNRNLCLGATVVITRVGQAWSYVSHLFVSHDGTASAGSTLFEVPKKLAMELYRRHVSEEAITRNRNVAQRLINRMDEPTWEDVRKVLLGLPSSQLASYRFRVTERIGCELPEDFDGLLEQETYQGFMSSLGEYEKRQSNELSGLVARNKRSKVHSHNRASATGIPDYVLNVLRRMGEADIHYLADRRKEIGVEEARCLLDMKVSRHGEVVFQRIQDIVFSLLGVKINAFSESGVDRPAELDVGSFLVEVNGSGIREALRLILDVECKAPDVLLVEEPELHLHPAIETSVMRYLKQISSRCQVFLTTHSTNFLDTADMQNVYLVSKAASTSVQLLNVEEAEEQIPRELGLRLSSFFMHDRLVFVEGLSDERVIRAWASTLGVNLSQANVGFVLLDGSRNLTYYAAEQTLMFLRKRQVQIWFLIDRDEKDSADIQRIDELLGENAGIVVLKRRELENYLICNRAIAEFVKAKREMNGAVSATTPTEAEVERVIEEAIEALKDLAVGKRVRRLLLKPMYPKRDAFSSDPLANDFVERLTTELERQRDEADNRLASIKTSMDKEKSSLDGSWKAEKRSIVPGDELLQVVCQRFGVKFNKEHDSERLAKLMNPDEIAEELKEVIRAIME